MGEYMEKYIITDTFINFGISEILELTEKQYESRKHLLKKLQGNKYEVLQTAQFKRGEIIGLEKEPDKALKSKLSPCEGKEVKKEKKKDDVKV